MSFVAEELKVFLFHEIYFFIQNLLPLSNDVITNFNFFTENDTLGSYKYSQ